MKIHRKSYIAIAVVTLLMVVVAIVSRIYYNSPTTATNAVVEEQQFYALVDKSGKELLHAVVYPGKDTILSDARDTVFLQTVTRYRPASWVNRTWMPFSFGCLAAKVDETAEKQSALAPLDNQCIASLLARKVQNIKELQQMYKMQLVEIDYYLNSHSMQDEGFDIVIRRRDAVVALQDSLTSLLKVMQAATKARTLTVAPRSRHLVVVDTLRFPAHEITCHKDGYKLFRTDRGRMPSTSRAVYLGVDNIGYGMTPAKALRSLQDTIFIGKRDKKTGKYAGNVRILCRNGCYYEGEVLDTLYEDSTRAKTVRHGMGVYFDTDRVRAGLWKNDIYKGEQPIYTSNHVYGIDISRYQHEPSGGKTVTQVKKVKVRGRWRKVKTKVKVTYPIDWNNLRISSLGTLSKKKVDGVVDYPISFVYIKATEGSSVINKYFFSDYSQARIHGFKVGAYHFYSTRTYASAQAVYFLKNSRYQKGDLPPVLDLEPSAQQIAGMGGPAAMLASARKWLEIVEKNRGVRPILYVSQKFVNRYMTSKYTDGEYLKKNYQVWIARYGEYKPDVHLLFWQLCPDGRVKGIHGYTDINIYNGYADSFNSLF